MPRKILAVDDEKNIVTVVKSNLERHGFQVIAAYDGKEALQKIQDEKPDLVILDVMMPLMDGFEVLQTMRRNAATRDIPVIMLTAKSQDTDVFRGWQSGVDLYLTKPFNPVELVSFVRRIFKTDNAVDKRSGAAKIYDIS